MTAIAPATGLMTEASSSNFLESSTSSTQPHTASATTPATTVKSTANGSKMSTRTTNAVPSDKVRLDVLLITGQRKNFDFDPQSSVKEVRELLWQDWPQDWPPRPISPSAIRILHLGHILEDKFILSPKEVTSGTSMMRAMPVGKSTVVHLLLSQAPSKADGDDESLKKNVRNDAGCCSCVIC